MNLFSTENCFGWRKKKRIRKVDVLFNLKGCISEHRSPLKALGRNEVPECYLAVYRFLGVRGLPWGDSGGNGGVTDDTLSESVECAIAGTSRGSRMLLSSDSTMSTHSES